MIEGETLFRKPGRPRKVSPEIDGIPLLSRDAVIECAYRLCDIISVDDLTLDQVARELGVSTTTVRHHIKTRSALTIALLGRYFQDMNARLRPITGDWQQDLDNHIHARMTINLAKPGFASFLFEHRFSKEIDPFGSGDVRLVSNHLLGILSAAGLSKVDVALAWHLILHVLLSVGYAQAHGQTPADQEAILEKIRAADDEDKSERAVVAALSQVDLPMIYGVISSMLRHAIAVRFDFPEEKAARPKKRKAAP